MITTYERSDLIHIMKMNRLALADSDTAQLEFSGQINGNDYRVKILMVESSPMLIVRSNGEVLCNETLKSIDDLKIFLEERLYKFYEV
jgi:hypothetical protein